MSYKGFFFFSSLIWTVVIYAGPEIIVKDGGKLAYDLVLCLKSFRPSTDGVYLATLADIFEGVSAACTDDLADFFEGVSARTDDR